jgi:hypothetical protein
MNRRTKWLRQPKLLSDSSEDPLLLVRLKILNGIDDRTNGVEIVRFWGAHSGWSYDKREGRDIFRKTKAMNISTTLGLSK